MGFEEAKKQLEAFPDYVKQGWSLAAGRAVLDHVSAITVCGMGGSAIPGDILSAYLKTRLPVYTVRDYTLPNHVDKNALVFIVSYSGNTEETLSCFRSALGLGCRIIGITSGGRLYELCQNHKKEVIVLPKGIQPREAFPLLFFTILRVLHNSKLVEDQQEYVDKTIKALSRDIYSEFGHTLALKLKGHIVLIYATEGYRGIAYRWKTQINENSKTMAFFHTFSELNHNEIAGYEHLVGDFYAVILQDESDSLKLKKRMRLTKEIISSRGVSSTMIAVKGSCRLSKMMSAVYMGDWTSVHLASIYGIDPTPVAIIEEFKRKL